MEKTKIFTITKDFGSKTLSKVFVKENGNETASILLKEKIADSINKAEKVCLVAENSISAELMELLCSARENFGLRIYATVSNLNEADFARLKNNCIVREVSNIKGNYLLCDSNKAFFYDGNLRGYALGNSATVKKLHEIFIYDFWNNAKKEFVSEIKPVAEQTFDVAPVLENKEVIINKKGGAECSYKELLDSADKFCIPEKLSDFIKEKSKEADLYLCRKVVEKNRAWLETENEVKIFYTDSLSVPLCKSHNAWYILNGSFAALLEEEPVFTSIFSLKNNFLYRDAVGKEILYLKDFSKVIVDANASEEKSISVDYKTFRQISRMAEDERTDLFEKKNLLQSEKLSASIAFSITMQVRKLSKGAKLAPIYDEYKKFWDEQEKVLKSLSDDIQKAEKKVSEAQNELSKMKSQLDDLQKQKKDSSELEKQLTQKEKSLETETKLLADRKSLLETAQKLSNKSETLEACKGAIAVFDSLKSFLPHFDKPRFGKLYKANAGYEYVLESDEYLENAEAEMQKANIQNVKFVDSE